jgi:putative redox protein
MNKSDPPLDEVLSGYKKKMIPLAKATLAWDRDLVFIGTTQRGYEINFDANSQRGCQPMETLLLSLAGCMGIDIVMILKKMRCRLVSFRLDLTGERNQMPPQYYRTVEMVMHLAGKDLDSRKVDRAIALSRSTYCSVFNSLRPDTELRVRYLLEESDFPTEKEG